MEIPVCPGCGNSSWESVEEYSGGSKRYELRANGWTLVDDWLDLNETDYSCRDCGYDPSDGEDDDELLALLNDIDTAPAVKVESDRAADNLSLWPCGRP